MNPDWRRLEVASRRFGDRIAGGIARSLEDRTEVDQGTARCIAHVLGRSLGRQSALADYARTGEGDYDTLRDEYLRLYNDDAAPASVKEQIDWLGTRLIRSEYPDARTTGYRDQYPLKLDQLLVPTMVEVGDWATTVHVPGNYSGEVIANDLAPTLVELRLDEAPALRAFLALPDVNAMRGDIMEDFHQNYVGTFTSEEEALHALCDVEEREREVQEHAAERRLYFDTITPDYEALRDEAEEAFDLVEAEGRVYVFSK
jgi:hypothetical protein